MANIKLIRKLKANFIRWKLHKPLGFLADKLIFLGYLIKMSEWFDNHASKFEYNDFYNRKVDHKERVLMYDFLLKKYGLQEKAVSYIEFGVGPGKSLQWWSEHNNNASSVLWGFDTFTGLPEQYGTYKPGTFDQGGNFPKIDDSRIKFVKGLFQDTLVNQLADMDFSKTTVVHVDCDLYTGTLFTLTVLYQYLKDGDIIIFDEFGVPSHEFKAFDEICKSFSINLKPVGAINNYLEAAFEVEIPK